MRTNPGGTLALEEIVGRDALIADLWDKLTRHGVMMTAERRMGKTSVLRKMLAQPPAGMMVFSWELEGVRSPEELVRKIFNGVREELGTSQKWRDNVQQFLKNWGMAGEKIMGVSLPKPDLTWQQHLEGIVKDLTDSLDAQEQLVFFFDEFPFMVSNIHQDLGATVAMMVLDTLRSIRQEYLQMRMVYTGSIGLHHVVAELKAKGYRNSPTNDLPSMDVGPLALPDAVDLAEALIIGEGIATESIEEVSQAIVEAVEGSAFYIHCVVAKLKDMLMLIGVAQVTQAIEDSLRQYKTWDMDHYVERINNYYGSQTQLALLALDELALESSLSPGDWWNRVSMKSMSNHQDDDDQQNNPREVFRSVLNRLEQDHYIYRNQSGEYQFRLRLVQQYWQQQRG